METGRLTKKIILSSLGVLFSTIPPALATLCFFPLWISKGSTAVLCGFTLLILVACALPAYKTLKRLLHSPASYTLWLVFFVAFLLLSKIADEMTVISFVGFISNLVGALFFKLSEKERTEENERQL